VHLVCVGGSDAGISAALRAREVDAGVEVTAVLTDAYPNFSICGIPYYLSGEVGEWRDLAHRSSAELEKAGVKLVTDTTATAIDVAERRLHVRASDGREDSIGYDALVIGTGAVPVRPPLPGLDALGPDDGVHVLHTIGDSRVLADHLARRQPGSALIVGGGYIGLEMAEALTTRGIAVTQAEMRSQVLPTVDPALAALIADELVSHDVDVRTSVTITGIDRAPYEAAGRLRVTGTDGFTLDVDLVLVVVGVRPDTALAGSAGATLAANGAIAVDRRMATNLPHVWAAGDCVQTHHQLLDTPTYLPLGTTAHKQGRIAGENALGGDAYFHGSLGTQVVKVFDLVAARTGLRQEEAAEAGFKPATVAVTADDHKAYYPGATPITIHLTGDTTSGRLLGAQLIGRLGAEIAKRVDVYATAIHAGLGVAQFADLDLSYAPPLGSPWDAVQVAAQAWVRAHRERSA